MRGWAVLPRSLPSKDQVDAARPLFEQALKIDPDNSKDEAHLDAIVREAQAMVNKALGSSEPAGRQVGSTK